MDQLSDPSFDDLALDLALQIDELCRRFEAEWHAGRQPRIGVYLTEVAETGHKALEAELRAAEREMQQAAPGPADPGCVAEETGEALTNTAAAAGTTADVPMMAPPQSPTLAIAGASVAAVHLDVTLAAGDAPGQPKSIDSTRMLPMSEPVASRDAGTTAIRYFGDYEIVREIVPAGWASSSRASRGASTGRWHSR